MTKLQLGHANVFEALLRQRGIQLASRFLPTRRLTKLEFRGQVRDQAGAWSRGCKARLRGCMGTQRRRRVMFIVDRQKRDSSVGAEHSAGVSFDVAPTELGRSVTEDSIDMPRLWRSEADLRYTC